MSARPARDRATGSRLATVTRLPAAGEATAPDRPPASPVETPELPRVLVTGSRFWSDRASVRAALDDALADLGPIVVVHGACRTGADAHADKWALDRAKQGVQVERHPADWDRNGNAAGPIRNTEMVRLGADLCLAFLTPSSRGGAQTAALAKRKNIPTIIHRSER